MPLCTIGYEKRSLDEYVDLLLEHRVEVVIDVRETAWSHKPGFSKTAFAAGLRRAGIEYVHLRIAGNPQWLRKEATSHAEALHLYRGYVEGHPEVMVALTETLGRLGVTHRRIALTCFERHPEDCHRGAEDFRPWLGETKNPGVWPSPDTGGLSARSPVGVRQMKVVGRLREPNSTSRG